MSKPLEGVKVIELATFIAAATAGRFMADLGADVIKIESAKGDPLRYTAPSEGRPLDMYENTTWDLENGNKRCISLNMKTPEGKEAFFKLLDSADVLITNWRVQALQRAGLDYETLKERYPKLVYAICTGYGEYGPDKDLPGFDFTAFFARGGYFETLRQRSDVPFNGAPGVGDHNVGMNLVAGILAALYQAKTKGVGEKVETSLFESAVYNMGMMVQASNYEGIAQQYPINIRNGANPFNSAWHTADDRYIQTCMPDYNTYYKKFIAEGDICFGVGQISSMDADELREIKERLIPFMVSECGRHGVSRVYFMLTDIMEQSTELLFYGEGSEEMAVNAFKIEPKDGTIYLKGVVSRKKQLIPPLMEAAQMIGSDYV